MKCSRLRKEKQAKSIWKQDPKDLRVTKFKIGLILLNCLSLTSNVGLFKKKEKKTEFYMLSPIMLPVWLKELI